ncbi:MAG: twin-arginine translocation pathway signal [Lautropia sp.]|nr:twin-arginine translocation pathway signal [Lautropia sp.]
MSSKPQCQALKHSFLKAGALSILLLSGCSAIKPAPVDTHPSILFVHDNGESAASWQTTLWRFESNGWPASKLHTLDLPYPYARDDDTLPQAGRSSSADFMAYLKAEVAAVKSSDHTDRIILIGSGRGANAIRNYVQNGDGQGSVSQAILAAPPSHGIWAVKGMREQSEFSGLSRFLQNLNRPKDTQGNEVPSAIQWLTLRSDHNDKYAQPTGEWLGDPLLQTNILPRSQELRGAQNVVLPGVDHREAAHSASAFGAMYQFITGHNPVTYRIKSEPQILLDGVISGVETQYGGFPSNLPLKDARLEIYPVNASTGIRTSQTPVYSQTTGTNGRWGGFQGNSSQTYEFVISAAGYPTHHIYRSPFPRSSDIINFRLQRIVHADPNAKSIIIMSRPRGYFDVHRDTMSFGHISPPPGIPPVGAGVSTSRMKSLNSTPETVVARFNNERIAGRTWPLADKHVVILELTD